MTPKQLILAILWNIFVIPGAGQTYLKHKKAGMIFTLVTVIILFVFVIHFTSVVMEQVRSVPVTTELTSLWAVSRNLSVDALVNHDYMLKLYGTLLGFCYFASVVDVILLYFKPKNGA